MSRTKGQLISKAFALIGLASYTYDLEPEEMISALEDLDAMMGEWSSENFQLGWPLNVDHNEASLQTETDLQVGAVSAVQYNLAVRLAPQYGKQLDQTTINMAANLKRMLKGRLTEPPRIIPQTAPAGQGNRRAYGDNYDNFTRPRQDRTITKPETEVDFKNG